MDHQQAINKRDSEGSQRGGTTSGWKKYLLRIGLLILAGVACLIIALVLVAKNFVTKDLLKQEIEKSIDSEVSIGELELSILSYPATITLKEVSLNPKGGSLTADSPVKIGELSLSLGLWELLQKHIQVTNITIRKAEITNTYYEDGRTSLQAMFESPDKKKRKHRGENKAKQGGFNAYDQEDFIATLGGLFIEEAQLKIILEGMGLRLICDDVDIELSSLTIDPRQLAVSNEARLKMRGHVRIYSAQAIQYADLYVSGESTARIFNPATGDAEPDVRGEFNLSDESWLSTHLPFITRAWNHLAVLEKVGIKVAKLPEQATFGRSKSISAQYHQGKVVVEKPLSIWVGDWELAVLGGARLDTKTDQHKIRAELLASQNASETLKPLIFSLVDSLPEQIRETVGGDLKQDLFRGDRLLVKIKSSGDFSDPKIRADGKIVDVSKATKEAAKEFLKQKAGGILDGLLK